MNYSQTYHNIEWVYDNIKTHFNINELVSPAVYNKYKERSWSFLDYTMLSNLLYIRKNRGHAITINHGNSQQRGLRENTSHIVKDKTEDNKIYLSGHVLGKAVDFHENSSGDSAEDIRNWIIENQEDLPFPCRLEHKKNGVPISWVHMDTAYLKRNPKVYLFDV